MLELEAEAIGATSPANITVHNALLPVVLGPATDITRDEATLVDCFDRRECAMRKRLVSFRRFPRTAVRGVSEQRDPFALL